MGEVVKETGVQRVGGKGRWSQVGEYNRADNPEKGIWVRGWEALGKHREGGRLWILPLKLALVQCSSLNLLHHLGQNTLPPRTSVLSSVYKHAV